MYILIAKFAARTGFSVIKVIQMYMADHHYLPKKFKQIWCLKGALPITVQALPTADISSQCTDQLYVIIKRMDATCTSA